MVQNRLYSNQKLIVNALRKMGCSVISLAQLGDGVPDLLCGFRGVTFLCEVKDGQKPPSAQGLTEDEDMFFRLWRGGPLKVIKSVEEAIAFVTQITNAQPVSISR